MSGTTTGIWISANSATVLQWSPQGSLLHRIVSSVPGRSPLHRATTHRGAPGRRGALGRAHADVLRRGTARAAGGG